MRGVVAESLAMIVALNILIFIAAVSVHELGHVFIASYVGCTGKAVIFDTQSPTPYSEIICPNSSLYASIETGSLFMVAFLGMPFLISRRYRHIFHIIVGTGIMLSAIDLANFFGIIFIEYATIVLGTAFIIFGEIRIIRSNMILQPKN